MLWNLYAHGDPYSELGEPGFVDAHKITKVLRMFLLKARAKALRVSPGNKLNTIHHEIHDCIYKGIPRTAVAIERALDRDSVKGVQFSEFARDWNYRRERQPLPGSYQMRYLIDELIKGCRVKHQAKVDELWHLCDFKEDGLLDRPESKTCFDIMFPKALGLPRDEIDPVTGLPWQIIENDPATGLPWKLVHEGQLAEDPFNKKERVTDYTIQRILKCCLRASPVLADELVTKLDKGGVPNVEKHEFMKDPYIFERLVERQIRECMFSIRLQFRKEFRAADIDKDGVITKSDVRAMMMRAMPAELAPEARENLLRKAEAIADKLGPMKEDDFNAKRLDLDDAVAAAVEEAKAQDAAEKAAAAAAQQAAAAARHARCDPCDLDHDGTITITELDQCLKTLTFLNLSIPAGERDPSGGHRNDLIRQCVYHASHELANVIMHAMDSNGRVGIQIDECEAYPRPNLVRVFAQHLARRCEHLQETQLERMWTSYDLDETGTLTPRVLRRLYLEMLDFARHFYGRRYADMAQCIHSHMDQLVSHVMRVLDRDQVYGIEKQEFFDNGAAILSDAEDVAIFCQRRISGTAGKKKTIPLLLYDKAYAKKLWIEYANATGRSLGQGDWSNGTLVARDLERIFDLMLDYARQYSSKLEVFDLLAPCLHEPEHIPRAAQEVVRKLDVNGLPGVQWDEFVDAPNALIASAEALIRECERKVGVGGGESFGMRFRQVPFSPLHFGAFRTGFIAPFEPSDFAAHEGRLSSSTSAHAPLLAERLQLRFDDERDQLPLVFAELATLVSSAALADARLLAVAADEAEEAEARAAAEEAEAEGYCPMQGLGFDGKKGGRGYLEKPKGLLCERCTITVVDSGEEQVFHALNLALEDNLRHALNGTCARYLTRDLTKSLTVSLTDSLVGAILKSASDPYVHMATRILTHSLSPSIAHSVSAVATKSLSRKPQDDYFCFYCKTKDVYCELCQGSATRDHFSDYYSSHYTHFYADHFGKFYTTEVDVNKIMSDGPPYTGAEEKPSESVDISEKNRKAPSLL